MLELHINKKNWKRFVGKIATNFHCGIYAFRLEITFQEVLERTLEMYFEIGNWGPEKLKWLTHINGRTGTQVSCFVQGRLRTYCSQQALYTVSVTHHPMCLSSFLRTHPTGNVKSEVHWMRWVCRRDLLTARQFGNVRTAPYFNWKGIVFITYLFTDLSAREAMMLVTPSFQALYCL